MLDTDRLRVFVSVAEAESLAGAGRRLYLSQPTVSHHLDALEATLGGTLVDRSPTGSRLTELGARVLPQARAILERIDDLETEARASVEQGVAFVNVGSFPSAASTLLPGPLASLKRRTPQFRLFVGEPAEITPRIGELALDVVLVYTERDARPSVPEWVQTEQLLDDPLLVLLPPGHRLRAQPELDLADLVDEPWITTTGDDDPEHTLLLQAHAEQGRELRFPIRADDFVTKQKLVSAGLGLSLLPQIATEETTGDVDVRPVRDPRFARRIHIAWRENRPPVVQGLVKDVQAEAARLRARMRRRSSPEMVAG